MGGLRYSGEEGPGERNTHTQSERYNGDTDDVNLIGGTGLKSGKGW